MQLWTDLPRCARFCTPDENRLKPYSCNAAAGLALIQLGLVDFVQAVAQCHVFDLYEYAADTAKMYLYETSEPKPKQSSTETVIL